MGTNTCAEQQKVKQILLYGVGDQSFRDFVGPRYTRLKELEMALQNLIRDSIVIVDTDSRIGEISVYGSETMVYLKDLFYYNPIWLKSERRQS
jgi:hypothetical protein